MCLIKDFEVARSSHIIQVGPKCYHTYTHKRETHTERRRQRDREDRDESDAYRSQGVLAAARCWKRQRAESPLEHDSADTLISDFRPAEL